MYYTTVYPSPVGRLTLASDGTNLIGLWIEGQKYFGGCVADELTEKLDIQVFSATKQWLDDYFSGKQPAATALPLSPIGSSFQQAVWKALCNIPYGKTTTYGEIAKILKNPRASQAVGSAVGRNPISIIIPCHRVVGASGSLTGYAGGIDKKIQLLKLEGVDTAQFTIPKKGTAL